MLTKQIFRTGNNSKIIFINRIGGVESKLKYFFTPDSPEIPIGTNR